MTRLDLLASVMDSKLHRTFIHGDEIKELAERFSDAGAYFAKIEMGKDYFEHWHTLLNKKKDRRGEVALFVNNDEHKVLLHTKPFYPQGIDRIPTGGIHADEAVLTAMERELLEETGFRVLEYHFIALVVYEFKFDNNSLSFPSYLFEIKADGHEPKPIDESEQISAFSWCDKENLRKVIDRLNSIEGTRWKAWGRFRSIPHEIYLEKEGLNLTK